MKDANPGRFVFNQSLDARFLDELFDGDAVYAQIVFEDFLRDLPEYWKDVATAYESQDLKALRTSIHKCKTLFGYVGFSDIQQLCQSFENSCSEKTFQGLDPGYRQLVQKKEEARRIIESEYDRLKLFNAADS